MTRILALALLGAALLAGCGNTAPAPAPHPGNPAVYERIAASSDCAALQREFDTAEANAQSAYMAAADARMRKVGCYS